MELTNVHGEVLLACIAELLRSERELTAKLIECLAEVEERRLHLEMGHSSNSGPSKSTGVNTWQSSAAFASESTRPGRPNWPALNRLAASARTRRR